MNEEKEFEFTKEIMDGFEMKVPERCMIMGCGKLAEYFHKEDEDLFLCFDHYHDIYDELENEKED